MKPERIWIDDTDDGEPFAAYSNLSGLHLPVKAREYILTTAIKDLPEDKLAELGVMRIKKICSFCNNTGHDSLGIGECCHCDSIPY